MRGILNPTKFVIEPKKKEEMTDIFTGFLDAEEEALSVCAAKTSAALDRGFVFAEEAFGDEMELSLLTSDLIRNPTAAAFISKYGCSIYFAHSDALLLDQKRREILDEVEKLRNQE